MKSRKDDITPDKILAPVSEKVFKEQFYNRNCILIDGLLYEIMEGSVASRIMLKNPIKKLKKTWYVSRRGQDRNI